MWTAVTPYILKEVWHWCVCDHHLNQPTESVPVQWGDAHQVLSLPLSLYHLHGHFAAGFVPKSTNHLMSVTQNVTLLMTTTLQCGRWAQHWHMALCIPTSILPLSNQIPSLRQLVMNHKLSHSEALNEHLKQRGAHTYTPSMNSPTHSLHLNRSQFHLCVGTNYWHHQESEQKSVLHWVYSYCSLSLISGVVSLWTITHKEDHGIPKHQVRFRLSSNDN